MTPPSLVTQVTQAGSWEGAMAMPTLTLERSHQTRCQTRIKPIAAQISPSKRRNETTTTRSMVSSARPCQNPWVEVKDSRQVSTNHWMRKKWTTQPLATNQQWYPAKTRKRKCASRRLSEGPVQPQGRILRRAKGRETGCQAALEAVREANRAGTSSRPGRRSCAIPRARSSRLFPRHVVRSARTRTATAGRRSGTARWPSLRRSARSCVPSARSCRARFAASTSPWQGGPQSLLRRPGIRSTLACTAPWTA
mmetsp:Transcript_14944/g.34226  ORF Transcript_14944/g.34226 Transcript_14944/m.34226 type:complete len:252 (+) Transcript_14944:380-1135(+)